jgi:hypothetical protein
MAVERVLANLKSNRAYQTDPNYKAVIDKWEQAWRQQLQRRAQAPASQPAPPKSQPKPPAPAGAKAPLDNMQQKGQRGGI